METGVRCAVQGTKQTHTVLHIVAQLHDRTILFHGSAAQFNDLSLRHSQSRNELLLTHFKALCERTVVFNCVMLLKSKT